MACSASSDPLVDTLPGCSRRCARLSPTTTQPSAQRVQIRVGRLSTSAAASRGAATLQHRRNPDSSPDCDIKPVCGDGEVAAIINSCFSCVDALTCEPAPEPEPDCDDGSSLSPFCDIKPVCGDGEVAAIIGSCFQCVDAVTCE